MIESNQRPYREGHCFVKGKSRNQSDFHLHNTLLPAPEGTLLKPPVLWKLRHRKQEKQVP